MSKSTLITIIVVLVVVAAIAFAMQSKKDNRSGIERAADDISNGIKDAGGEFREKSTGERIGDSIKDAGQSVKDSAR